MKLVARFSFSDIIAKSFVCFYFVIILTNCSHLPSAQVDKEAFSLGFSREVVAGKGFQHVTYLKDADTPSKSLHVYLEGDGSPWVNHKKVANDPTPRNPFMLQLMALDSGPAVYLGRPCYYGMKGDSLCKPELWTSARYSRPVIDSMVAALNMVLEDFDYDSVVLIGHSGGGTIAMLMAEQLSDMEGVITIAGNLDIEAWARFHDYLPLNLSLNPSTRPPLNPNIYQLHLVGEHDEIIPPEMIRSAIDNHANIEIRVVAGFRHTCCWKDIWPDILAQLTTK